LRAEAEAEAKAAEAEDEKLAAEFEDEVEGEPEPEGYDDEMPIEQALEPEEKKPWERPEILAIGAVVILGGILLLTRRKG
jgi:cytoskeletal protein RodZ